MAYSRIVLTHAESSAQMDGALRLDASDPSKSAVSLADYFNALAIGAKGASVAVKVGAVKAAGTITFTGIPTANETCSVANVTFTAKSSGATGNQFNVGASATAAAANLAAAINASSSLTGIVTASAASGVVTITSVVPGVVGNAIQLSESLSNATVTAAMTGGSDGTAYSVDLS